MPRVQIRVSALRVTMSPPELCACVGSCTCLPVLGDRDLDAWLCAPSEGRKAVAIKVDAKGGGFAYAIGDTDLESLRGALKGRGNIVMTRVADEDLAAIDLLVDAGLFDSRSECAAFLIRSGLAARKDLTERVKTTAEKIRELKEKLRKDVAS